MKYLIIVDMQKDFVDGALGTKEAVSIVPNVVERMKNFDGEIICTRDTHYENYMETQEGRNLPLMHCIKGTEGFELVPEVKALCTSEPIDKSAFGSIELGMKLQKAHEKEAIESIELIGVCTDICVISNAFIIKSVLPEVPIIVDASCCAGVTPESHLRALESMKTCQIQVINE